MQIHCLRTRRWARGGPVRALRRGAQALALGVDQGLGGHHARHPAPEDVDRDLGADGDSAGR